MTAISPELLKEFHIQSTCIPAFATKTFWIVDTHERSKANPEAYAGRIEVPMHGDVSINLSFRSAKEGMHIRCAIRKARKGEPLGHTAVEVTKGTNRYIYFFDVDLPIQSDIKTLQKAETVDSEVTRSSFNIITWGSKELKARTKLTYH